MQEVQATQAQEMTYEEALKAFKATWAEKRKEEKASKKAEEKSAKREATVEVCKKALEVLQGIDSSFNKELAPVITRLNMFVKGERYTRNVGGEE